MAAISVAAFHFSGPLSSEAAKFIGTYTWLGVDVFFVISGFVIPLSLHGRGYRPSHFPTFMLRRLLRLEPPYLASIAMVILLGYLSSLAPGFQGDTWSFYLHRLPRISSISFRSRNMHGFSRSIGRWRMSSPSTAAWGRCFRF